MPIREANIAIIGSGKTFGDIDAYKKRNYLYSLKSCSSNVRYYEIDASKFVMHLCSHGKESQFKRWQKKQDMVLIN